MSGSGGGQNAPFFVDNEVIVLTANGLWIADGSEISHEPTRRLFVRSLRKDAHGWFLAIGRETKRITVEDTAYFVHRVDGTHAEGFTLWISDGSREPLEPATLHYRPGRLTCRIKGAAEEAKFLRAPYIEILREITEVRGAYWLEIAGHRVRIGPG